MVDIDSAIVVTACLSVLSWRALFSSWVACTMVCCVTSWISTESCVSVDWWVAVVDCNGEGLVAVGGWAECLLARVVVVEVSGVGVGVRLDGCCRLPVVVRSGRGWECFVSLLRG